MTPSTAHDRGINCSKNGWPLVLGTGLWHLPQFLRVKTMPFNDKINTEFVKRCSHQRCLGLPEPGVRRKLIMTWHANKLMPNKQRPMKNDMIVYGCAVLFTCGHISLWLQQCSSWYLVSVNLFVSSTIIVQLWRKRERIARTFHNVDKVS